MTNTHILPQSPEKIELTFDDLGEPFDPETDVWMLTPYGLHIAVPAYRAEIAEHKLGWRYVRADEVME